MRLGDTLVVDEFIRDLIKQFESVSTNEANIFLEELGELPKGLRERLKKIYDELNDLQELLLSLEFKEITKHET